MKSNCYFADDPRLCPLMTIAAKCWTDYKCTQLPLATHEKVYSVAELDSTTFD